ncbi:GNAT family N-acetyltransferase [Kribbella alba]
MGIAQGWPAGVEARPIEKADAEAWADLLAAKEKVDQEGENYDADNLLEELDDPKLNAATDTLGLWSGGQLVGYGKVTGPDEVVDVDRVFAEGAVHPQWRGKGVGDALMSWLIPRATALHRERHPEAPGEIGVGAISTNTSADQPFSARGFEPCRYFFGMERDLGADPVPDSPVAGGLRLVGFDPSYDERLRVAHNEVFLDHWGSTPRDPESWRTWFTGSRTFRAAQSFLVLDGERIAAYVLGYEYVADTAATGIKELYVGQVGTRRDHRGKGAARAALARVMTVAQEADFKRVSLGVDAENPTGALGLYEKLGFRMKTKSISYRRPIS